MRNLAKAFGWVCAAALFASACNDVEPNTDGAATTSAVGERAAATSAERPSDAVAPSSTSVAVATTAAASPSTTSAKPPKSTQATATSRRRRQLAVELVSEPSGATGTLETANGVSLAITTPWRGQVGEGAATLTLDSDGFNTRTVDLDVSQALRHETWLDDAGQLVETIISFEVEGAPKQVAFTPDNSELWVTLLDGAGLEVYDPFTGEEIAEIDLPSGGSVEVIFNRAGTIAYVSQMQTSSLYEIDVATKQIVRNLPTKSAWTKVLVLSPDETMLYASNWSGHNVTEFDLATGEVVRQISTVRTPRGLYVTPDGAELWVAGFSRGEIQVIDLATGKGTVIYRSGGSMRHLVGDPERGLVYASDMTRAQALVVDTTTREVVELAPVDRTPNTIDLSPDGRVLYVSSRGRNHATSYHRPGPDWGAVAVIDTATGEYLDAIVGGNQPTGLDVSPDGSLLAHSDFLDHRVTTYRLPTYETYANGGGGRWDAHLSEIRK